MVALPLAVDSSAASSGARVLDCPKVERLTLNLAADVTIRPGPGRITVRAAPEVLKGLKWGQLDGVWTLSGIQQASDRSPVKVEVEVPRLHALSLMGALDVMADGCLADHATLVVSGACDYRQAGLQLQSLQLNLSGSTTVQLRGRCTKLMAEVDGSSELLAHDLQCQSVTLRAEGSGDLKVWAQRELMADLGGATTLWVRGQPKLRQRLMGAASIEA